MFVQFIKELFNSKNFRKLLLEQSRFTWPSKHFSTPLVDWDTIVSAAEAKQRKIVVKGRIIKLEKDS